MNRPYRLGGMTLATALVAALMSSCAHNTTFSQASAGPEQSVIDRALNSARAARNDGDLDTAASRLAYLVSIAPDNPQVLGEYAKVLTEMGRPDDALVYFKQAISRDADDWKLYNAEGVAYDEKHDFVSAQAAYNRALQLSPGEPAVLNDDARSHMMAGDLTGAEALLAQAEPSAEREAYLARTQRQLSSLEVASGSNAPVAALTPKGSELPSSGMTKVSQASTPSGASAPLGNTTQAARTTSAHATGQTSSQSMAVVAAVAKVDHNTTTAPSLPSPVAASVVATATQPATSAPVVRDAAPTPVAAPVVAAAAPPASSAMVKHTAATPAVAPAPVAPAAPVVAPRPAPTAPVAVTSVASAAPTASTAPSRVAEVPAETQPTTRTQTAIPVQVSAPIPARAAATLIDVRVGTYLSRMHARHVLARVAQQEHGHLVRLSYHGRHYYRVWLGDFLADAEAEQTLTSLHSRGYLHARIIARQQAPSASRFASVSAP